MICILDTSILCELLQVPGKSQDAAGIAQAFKERAADGAQFIVPFAAILETGNHIGQAAGNNRHGVANRFRAMVEQSMDGSAPFAVHPFPDPDTWRSLLRRLPAWAAQGSGLGDLTILEVYEAQKRRFPKRSVKIWSKDRHLTAYGA